MTVTDDLQYLNSKLNKLIELNLKKPKPPERDSPKGFKEFLVQQKTHTAELEALIEEEGPAIIETSLRLILGAFAHLETIANATVTLADIENNRLHQ